MKLNYSKSTVMTSIISYPFIMVDGVVMCITRNTFDDHYHRVRHVSQVRGKMSCYLYLINHHKGTYAGTPCWLSHFYYHYNSNLCQDFRGCKAGQISQFICVAMHLKKYYASETSLSILVELLIQQCSSILL